MTDLYNELMAQIKDLAATVTLPTIKDVILPSAALPATGKYAKFGLLTLSDDSAGFFYRLLDIPEWREYGESGYLKELEVDLIGEKVSVVAELMTSEDSVLRGIGIAAASATSQHVFHRTGWTPWSATPTTEPKISHSTHVGMVGYFGPIVHRLAEQKVKLTVLELDESLFQSTDSLIVTGDPSQLKDCDHILCTASTLLNNTLESLLSIIGPDPYFELVGPTGGCFADALFLRGVNSIGGSTVVDTATASSRIRSLEPWGDSVKKYVITPETYPGFGWFIDTLSASNM